MIGIEPGSALRRRQRLRPRRVGQLILAGDRVLAAQLRLSAAAHPTPRRSRNRSRRAACRRQDPRGFRRRAGRDRRLADRRRPQRFRGPSAHRHDQRVRLLRGHAGRHRRAGPSTCTTSKAPAAAMRRTCSGQRLPPTSSRRRPTRPTPSPPTRLEEGVPMTMLAHNLNYNAPEDVAFARSAHPRRRPWPRRTSCTTWARSRSSRTDTQGMGRLAENVAKCWQLASVMKERVGRLPEEKTARADNERIKRYVAKIHDQPGDRASASTTHVGSIEAGQAGRSRAVAARLLRRQAVDGDQERLRRLGGDGRRQRQPDQSPSRSIQKRDVGSARRRAKHRLGVNFVSKLAIEADVGAQARRCSKRSRPDQERPEAAARRDMVRNDAMPHIEVDPQTFEVRADGKLLMCRAGDEGAACNGGTCSDESYRTQGRSSREVHRCRARRHRRAGRLGQDGAGRAPDPGAAEPRHRPRGHHQRPRHPRGRRAPPPLRADRSGAGARRWRPAPARTP